MNISIFGLGYVGCVSLGCLAQNGHNVIGVDILQEKVDLINRGQPTIIEKDIDKIIENQFKEGKISATTDFKEAVLKTDVTIICVGTPSSKEGHLNLDYVFNSAKQIGEALKVKDTFHVVAIRSTVLPGTNERVSKIIQESSGKEKNVDFAVVSNPEFLREGSAVADYYNPPLTILGSDSEKAIDVMSEIYSKVNGPIEVVAIKVAEINKYVNNSFHALKIVFANEVGNICKKLDIDSHEVMRVFCMDTQLNISPSYLKPGFAYGGSCLPKDLRALKMLAYDNYIDSPVLNAVENSNLNHKQVALNTILETGKTNIGFLSISFKSGTDDLRYSPSVEVIEQLLGKGKLIKIFDENVSLSKLIGANKSYIEQKLPHVSNLLCNSVEDLINESEVVVIPNKMKNIEDVHIPEDKVIIDLCRVGKFESHPGYIGLNW